MIALSRSLGDNIAILAHLGLRLGLKLGGIPFSLANSTMKPVAWSLGDNIAILAHLGLRIGASFHN